MPIDSTIDSTIRDAADDKDGQSPALVIQCEPLLMRVIAVVGRNGATYRLRDDVPTERLIWAFNIIQRQAEVTAAGQTGDWEAYETALDARERETWNVATTIMRHSYPTLSRADVMEALTPAQRDALVDHFFTSRLAPLLEQRIASALAARQAAQTAQAAETEALAEPTPPATPPVTATSGTGKKPRKVASVVARASSASVGATPTPKL